LSGSEWVLVDGCLEQGNEPSGCTVDKRIFDRLSDYQLLTKDCVLKLVHANPLKAI
jgi:hypothetical protein